MLPLDDVKVVDFMWALAGPGTTRTLADYGATVVRIESATKIDGARTVGPFQKNKPSNDGSGLFGTYNAGKLGLSLESVENLRREKWCSTWCNGLTWYVSLFRRKRCAPGTLTTSRYGRSNRTSSC